MSTKPAVYKPKHQSASIGRTYNGRLHIDQMYDKEWRAYRERFLHHNPLCYRCGSKSTVVDHLIAHKGDVKLFKQTTNHLPLCKSCHDQCTSLFDRNYKVGAPIEKKAKWLKARRAELGLVFKVKILPSYE